MNPLAAYLYDPQPPRSDPAAAKIVAHTLIESGHSVAARALPIMLRGATATGTTIPEHIVWMPAGTHAISAHGNGEPWYGTVVCDEAGALNVQRDFAEAKARGERVWLDAGHDDSAAVGDIQGIGWVPGAGIVAAVTWTPYGENLLREKQFNSFSPAFYANRETGRVEGMVTRHASGGLVNAPAFAAMPALIAARQAPQPQGGSAAAARLVFDTMLRAGGPLGLAQRVRDMILRGDAPKDVAAYLKSIHRN